MRTITVFAIIMFYTLMGMAQTTLYITANGQTCCATLESNASVEEFKKLLPLTIHMSDYGGWEKVGDLPTNIMRDDRQMTACPGDIMLYQGRRIVIFYGENSWAYTPLGRIIDANASSIRDFLRGNSIDVTFSLSEDAGVKVMEGEERQTTGVYDLCGRKTIRKGGSLMELPKGIHIINGKKTIIK